jgi:hypothetical protein
MHDSLLFKVSPPLKSKTDFYLSCNDSIAKLDYQNTTPTVMRAAPYLSREILFAIIGAAQAVDS